MFLKRSDIPGRYYGPTPHAIAGPIRNFSRPNCVNPSRESHCPQFRHATTSRKATAGPAVSRGNRGGETTADAGSCESGRLRMATPLDTAPRRGAPDNCSAFAHVIRLLYIASHGGRSKRTSEPSDVAPRGRDAQSNGGLRRNLAIGRPAYAAPPRVDRSVRRQATKDAQTLKRPRAPSSHTRNTAPPSATNARARSPTRGRADSGQHRAAATLRKLTSDTRENCEIRRRGNAAQGVRFVMVPCNPA